MKLKNSIETKAKILVVDGDPRTVVAVKESLEKYGYNRIENAINGEEAIQLARTGQPDLILMDIDLDGAMNGIETSEKINELAEIPIIFVTARSYDTTIQSAKQVVPYGYLIKPFESQVLFSTIEMAMNRFSLEKRLSENEEQLQEVLGHQLDSSYKRNLQTNTYDYLSPSFYRISGYTPEEMKTIPMETVLGLIHPDDLPEIKQVMDEATASLTGNVFHVDYRFKHKLGNYLWFHDQFTVMRDFERNNLALIGSLSDITERKNIEEVLLKSKKQYDNLVSNIPVGVYILHSTPQKTYLFTYVSPRMAEMLGVKEESILANPQAAFQSIHPDDIGELNKLNQDHFLHPRLFNWEGRAVIRGEIIWIHIVSFPEPLEKGNFQWHGVISDITERKLIEEKLRESEERFRALYDNAPVGLYRTTPDGKILLANKSLCKMLGYSSVEDLLKINLAQSGNESPYQRKLFVEKIEKHGEVKDLEAIWERRDCSTIIVKESAKAIKDSHNRTLYYDGTVEDISERKLIEETQMFLLHTFNNGLNGDFFSSLAKYLANCLEMDYVCIDKLCEGNLAAETLAIYFDGIFEDNVEYTLKETPCGDAVGKTICCFPEKVRHLFPNDSVLQEMKAESYIGTTLWSSDHRPIGLIAVIGRRPLQNHHLAETILKLVAIRAAGELEKKHVEEVLKESEVKYQLVFENSGTCNSIFNTEFRLILQNKLSLEMLGTPNGEAIGKNVIEVFGQQEGLVVEKRMREVIATRKPLVFETEFNLPGGKKWFRSAYQPLFDKNEIILGVQVISQDITERKKTEEELADTKAMLEAAFEQTPLPMVLVSMPDAVLQIVNNACRNFLGIMDEPTPAGQQLINFTPSYKDYDSFGNLTLLAETPLAHAIKGIRILNQERRIVTKDGTTRWALVSGNPIYNQHGELIAAYLVFPDITELKQAEVALRQSEERFKQLVWDMQVGVLLQGPNAEILLSNPKALELLGISEDQLLGKTSFDLNWNVIHEDGSPFPGSTHPVPTAIAYKKSVLGVVMGVYRPKTEDRIWLLVDAEPELNSDGTVEQVVCTFIDITERKQAEEKIKKLNERFTLATRVAKIGIWDWNIINNNLVWDQNMYELYGRTKDNILGAYESWMEAIHPEDKDWCDSESEKARKGEKDYDTQFRIILSDGTIRYIRAFGDIYRDENGTAIRMIGANFDISGSRNAEEELKSSNSLLNATLESTADAILVINTNRKITLYNNKFVELWKIPNDLLAGKDDEKLLNFVIAQVIKPEEFLSKIKELYIKPEESSYDRIYLSEERVFERYSKPQKIGDAIVGRVWSFSDITERSRVRRELENYKTHLEDLVKERTGELDKANEVLKRKIEKENEFKLMLQKSLEREKELNEMKSQFISTASHEFRTPLTSILSSAGLIQRYSKQWSDEKKTEHYDKIQNSVTYLTKLLDDVLTINRVESGNIKLTPEQIDLKKFVQECVDESKNLSEIHQIHFNYQVLESSFLLDSKLLKFIINNLLSNAVKYSPGGGKVEVNISSSHCNLNIEISDEGIGIHNREAKKIFDPFYRSKNAENIPGNGLGLSIVKRAVDLHKGEITVESELNKGTKFTVKLPIHKSG